jgi:hypothetical protein
MRQAPREQLAQLERLTLYSQALQGFPSSLATMPALPEEKIITFSSCVIYSPRNVENILTFCY